MFIASGFISHRFISWIAATVILSNIFISSNQEMITHLNRSVRLLKLQQYLQICKPCPFKGQGQGMTAMQLPGLRHFWQLNRAGGLSVVSPPQHLWGSGSPASAELPMDPKTKKKKVAAQMGHKLEVGRKLLKKCLGAWNVKRIETEA